MARWHLLLFFQFTFFFAQSDTVDFWQLRVHDHIIIQGWCGNQNNADLPLFEPRQSELSNNDPFIIYGGCFIPSILSFRVTSKENNILYTGEVRNNGGFRIPAEWWDMLPKEEELIVQLKPDRSADGIKFFFPAFRMIIR